MKAARGQVKTTMDGIKGWEAKAWIRIVTMASGDARVELVVK
jgi:hypothetical protein